MTNLVYNMFIIFKSKSFSINNFKSAIRFVKSSCFVHIIISEQNSFRDLMENNNIDEVKHETVSRLSMECFDELSIIIKTLYILLTLLNLDTLIFLGIHD
jgi:hypothetical protein